jgi:gluconokinase
MLPSPEYMPARPPTPAILALDVGTSSARASLYDAAAHPIPHHEARIAYAPTTTPEGGAEFDANWLLDQVRTAIDNVLSQSTCPPIAAVATDTFWHSLLGLGSDGLPRTPLYLWLDARSRTEVARLRQDLDQDQTHSRTGCMLHWSYWPAKLRWLQRTNTVEFNAVDRWVSFGEFLLEQLTKEQLTSISMASGTGLLDVHTCTWDPEMLSACNIRAEQLGDPAPMRHSVCASNSSIARWPKLRGVPWFGAVGDGACSNIGADCTTAGRVALMIGTSGAERVVFRADGEFAIPSGTWCYRVDEHRAVLGGALNDGGSLLDWLRDSLQLPDARQAEASIAAMPPDAHGLTVLPFWGGERSPGWADDARGAIIGLRLHTTPEDILRACMEAVALRFGEVDRRIVDAMPAVSDGDVIATGGALLHSPAWMQMLADVLGRPVLASSEDEASSRGAALLALEALGQLREPLETRQPRTRARFDPVAEHIPRYRAAAERQRRMYDALVS